LGSGLVVAGLLWFFGAGAASAAEIRGLALVGEPFGVGLIELRLAKQQQPRPLGLDGLGLEEKGGRAFYPAVAKPLLGGRLRNALDRPVRVRIYYLFRGHRPLEVTILAGRPYTIRAQPVENERAHDELLQQWWRHYSGWGRLIRRGCSQPQLLATYLTTMLSRRLGLELPQPAEDETWQNRFREELGLVGSLEPLRSAWQRQRMPGRAALRGPADRPLPEPIAPVPPEPRETAPEAKIERMAQRVPAECFYVRFGSFENFLWLQDRMALWNRDLGRLVGSQGLEVNLQQRMEEQLVLRQSALARLLGPAVVADVALVGTDFWFDDGAAYGLLFQAQPGNPLLAADLLRQRLERVQADAAVREEKFDLAGHEVSFLSSPDGRVRSYYVADGEFHFVTTSRRLAERFVQTGHGNNRLADAADFRRTRARMPLERRDTVFVYLSEAMLRHLVSPAYRIELWRRIQSRADIELVRLAQLAAAAEGRPRDTIEQLVRGGLLPQDFGLRPDGSRTVLGEDGPYDSRRGRLGRFVPVPDVSVERVTAAEVEAYRQFAEYYQSRWERLGPVEIAIRRTATDTGRERILMEAAVGPLGQRQWAWLTSRLAPPQSERLADNPGDLARLEVVFAQGRLVIGLRDQPPRLGNVAATFAPGGWLQLLATYVATTGRLEIGQLLGGWLGLVLNTGGGGDALGLLEERTVARFTLFSFDRRVLEEVAPRLRLVDAERPAQLWLHIGDLSRSQLARPLNRWAYRKSRRVSLNHLRLLHALSQQLRVPGKDCRSVAEELLNGRLACPLGGEYTYVEGARGSGHWVCTALAAAGGQPSVELPSPVVRWLRRLDAELRVEDQRLSVRVDLEVDAASGAAATTQ